MQKISGEMKLNGDVVVDFIDNTKTVKQFHHKLKYYDEGKSFGWSDPFFLFLYDDHLYRLEEMPGGKTKFIQSDAADGFSSLFFGTIATDFMLTSYMEFNSTLKEIVEKK